MYLLVGDLHLTDRAQDSYRFGLFPWLRKQQEKLQPTATFILGDLTDRKDNHSSKLVNLIVDALSSLQKPVYILKGNHDYIDPNMPYFKFLNKMDGITFISEPQLIREYKIACVPHYHSEEDFAHACEHFNGEMDFIFVHQTFTGSIAETGVQLTGYSTQPVEILRPRLGCYAGDVHRPQRSGPVTYVGSPYTIRFGDDFDPHIIRLNEDGSKKYLHYDCPRKWSLTIRDVSELKNYEIMKGDQVKLIIELAREEAVEWKTHKAQIQAACKELGADVFGIELKVNSATPKAKLNPVKSRAPKDILKEFSVAEKLPAQTRDAGLKLLG